MTCTLLYLLVAITVLGSLVAPSTAIVLQDGNLTLAVPDLALTWKHAQMYCSDNGGHLATVDDNHVQALLGTLMRIKGLSFLWIGAREKETGWAWADDEQGQGTFNAWAPGHPVNKDTEPACTFLRGSQDFEWLDHPCAMPHSFICEMELTSGSCQHPSSFLFSKQDGVGACLVLHQRAPRSWYKAREACVAEGGRLAVFHDAQLYGDFSKHLGQKLQVSGDYWIGLRDASLEWEDGDSVVQTWWEGGQPSRAGRCVHVEKFGVNVYLWANQDCARTQAFVCQQIPEPDAPHSAEVASKWSVPTTKTVQKGPLHLTLDKFINSILFQVVAFVLGVLLMMIPLIVVCMKLTKARRANRLSLKSQSMSRSTLNIQDSGTVGSTRPLVGTSQVRQQQEPPPLAVTQCQHPPMTQSEPNVYTIQPQNHAPNNQGHPRSTEGHQGHQPYDLPGGAQPHGYVNNTFQSPPQAIKAHAQAMAAYRNSSAPVQQTLFANAHGQPCLQRQSDIEMLVMNSQDEHYESQPQPPEAVLYRV